VQQNWKKQRKEMVEKQLVKREITDKAILQAFGEVPRHKFIPQEYKKYSYSDRPLPIAENQTISQPYIVAAMIKEMEINSDDSVLEIGIGSGYAAAILSKIVKTVFGVEMHQDLVNQAKNRLSNLGYKNIEIKQGDGTKGWEKKAPFDGVIVSAAAPEIPGPLLQQLKNGNNLIIPLGDNHIQNLTKIRKEKEGYKQDYMEMVRFVPLVKEEGWE
jgi:protein-L-isoaspartate(D-aspartate) O-methyltransferase